MVRSRVAAVLDGYGGWHVVVTQPHDMQNHVRAGQLLVLVPNLTVKEPVEWGRIPALLARVEQYILRWIEERNDPELRDHIAVKLFLLRRTRGFCRNSVNLHDIVET